MRLLSSRWVWSLRSGDGESAICTSSANCLVFCVWLRSYAKRTARLALMTSGCMGASSGEYASVFEGDPDRDVCEVSSLECATFSLSSVIQVSVLDMGEKGEDAGEEALLESSM